MPENPEKKEEEMREKMYLCRREEEIYLVAQEVVVHRLSTPS